MASTINASTTAGIQVTGDTSGSLALQTNNGTTAVTIDTSQNVGIGTTSPTYKLDVQTSNDALLNVQSTGSIQSAVLNLIGRQSSVNEIWSLVSTGSGLGTSALRFTRGGWTGTPAMTLDGSGNLLVGTTSNYGGRRLDLRGSNADYLISTTNSNANPNGIQVFYDTATPNGTANGFINCQDATQTRLTVRSNGGIANFSANNVNLSDIRTKTDINLAGNYLDKICSIPVKTFKYKDQIDEQLNLGVIAQDVEAVAPELVDVSGFGETPEDGVPLKAIYQTDLQYALMKCIQEQQTIITELKARIEVLENK